MKINQNLLGSFLELTVFQVLPKEPRDISSVMLTVEGSSLKISNKSINITLIFWSVHETNQKIEIQTQNCNIIVNA